MNSVNMVGLLTASSKVDGDYLYIVLDNQGEMPTLGFKGKQREAIEKWGEPKRMVSVSGALRTVINGNQKMTFVDVAYSRFLDSQKKVVEEAKVVAPAKAAAPAKAPAKAPPKVSAKAPAKAAATAAVVDNDVPW